MQPTIHKPQPKTGPQSVGDAIELDESELIEDSGFDDEPPEPNFDERA